MKARCDSVSSKSRKAPLPQPLVSGRRLEETISEFAPDTVNLIIEGVEPQIAASGFVPLHVLMDSARHLLVAEAK